MVQVKVYVLLLDEFKGFTMSAKNEARTQVISQVIEKMHKKGRVTKKDVQDMLSVSSSEASRYLTELARLGMIKKKQTQSGRTQYSLDIDSKCS